MATIDKKLVDCYWYLQNQCTKGDACEYRHNVPLNNTTVCKLWSEGQCKNPNCQFRHPSGVQAKDRAQVVCYYFSHGGCMKGSSCPYSHNVEIEIPTKELQELEDAKKKQEQELKKLQQLRIQEEERLAKLRVEEASLKKKAAKTKNIKPQNKRKEIESTSEPKTLFVKSFDAIIKEKSAQPSAPEKVIDNQNKAKKKKTQLTPKDNTNPAASQNPKSKPQKTASKPAKQNIPQNSNTVGSSKPNFGVKTFDQIVKEKHTPNADSESSTTTTNATTETKVVSLNQNKLEELRKKNEKKFSQTSPKISRSVPMAKKTKVEAPSTVPTVVTQATNIKNAQPLETLDNFEDVESDPDDAMIDIDGEDLDQQLNELETLIQ